MPNRKIMMGFRIEPEVRDLLVEGAKARNITVSEYVVVLIKAALKLKRFKDPQQ